MTQLQDLVRPFPSKYVHSNQGRGSYVEHGTVVQRLLHVLGPYTYELKEVIRGTVKGKEELGPVVVGVIARLNVIVDDQFVTVEEVGDCETPSNWPHDGARLKDASSDAIKRCAMRLGVALHLWAGPEFYLPDALAKKAESSG